MSVTGPASMRPVRPARCGRGGRAPPRRLSGLARLRAANQAPAQTRCQRAFLLRRRLSASVAWRGAARSQRAPRSPSSRRSFHPWSREEALARLGRRGPPLKAPQTRCRHTSAGHFTSLPDLRYENGRRDLNWRIASLLARRRVMWCKKCTMTPRTEILAHPVQRAWFPSRAAGDAGRLGRSARIGRSRSSSCLPSTRCERNHRSDPLEAPRAEGISAARSRWTRVCLLCGRAVPRSGRACGPANRWNRLCQASMEELVTGMVDAKMLSHVELDQLEEFVRSRRTAAKAPAVKRGK